MAKRDPGGQDRPAPRGPGRKIFGILWRAALVAAVLAAATWWQARGLLPSGEPAPRLTLPALDGGSVDVGAAGRPAVLYFFAPWCGVCGSTSSNIAGLREGRGEDELAIWAIGLDYDDESEVRRFAREHGLRIPVLLGDDQTRRAFRVGSYPTIYILDRDGRIDYRLVGYTTSLGLRLRLLFG